MSSSVVRPPWVAWLYTHNPFYAISVMLMLYGVLAGYGKLEIGSINNWIMMGTLATYTVVLAGITIAIVRWGKVWDDARSLFALLLLLFLAVSISGDELFVRESTARLGMILTACGWLATAVLSEGVLRGTRVRLPWSIRGPYHLLLALFYFWPALCSAEVIPQSAEHLEEMICLFPTVAAGLFALLLPAVRCGSTYTKDNGTPYPWPWFPWTMFVFIAGAVMIRSFILCLTFGPTGSIWTESSGSLGDINFDSIFGLYFFLPLLFVILLLILEGAIVAENRAFQVGVIALAPMLILLAMPISTSEISSGLLYRIVNNFGSPVWIAGLLLMLLYARAWIARVPLAEMAFAMSTLLFSVVGRQTLDFDTLCSPQTWPLVLVGGILLVRGFMQQASAVCWAGFALCTYALFIAMPVTVPLSTRGAICFHLLWGVAILLGLAFRDSFASLLRLLGAMLIPGAALVAILASSTEHPRMIWCGAYLVALSTASLLIGLWRERWYLFAFGSVAMLIIYELTALGYYQGIDMIGRSAMIALSWSVGFLLIAVLISARKANWLPSDLIARTLFGEGTWLRL